MGYNSEEQNNEKQNKLAVTCLILGGLMLIAAVILPLFMKQEYIEQLSSLVSSASFFIVLSGILYQRDELKLQRKELKNQGIQLEEQANEMKHSRVIHENEVYLIKRHQFETTLFSLVDRKNKEIEKFYNPQTSAFQNLGEFLGVIEDRYGKVNRSALYRIKPYIHSVINIYGYIREMDIIDKDKEKLFEMLRYLFHSTEKQAIQKYIVYEENEEDQKILNYAIENLIAD